MKNNSVDGNDEMKSRFDHFSDDEDDLRIVEKASALKQKAMKTAAKGHPSDRRNRRSSR